MKKHALIVNKQNGQAIQELSPVNENVWDISKGRFQSKLTNKTAVKLVGPKGIAWLVNVSLADHPDEISEFGISFESLLAASNYTGTSMEVRVHPKAYKVLREAIKSCSRFGIDPSEFMSVIADESMPVDIGPVY